MRGMLAAPKPKPRAPCLIRLNTMPPLYPGPSPKRA